MKKIVFLTKSFGRLIDRTPFRILSDESLDLEIKSNYDKFVAVFVNGKTRHTSSVSSELSVPKEVIFPGELKIRIDAIDGSDVVHSYYIEPILIKSVGDNFEGFLEIEELKKNIEELNARLEILEDKHKPVR